MFFNLHLHLCLESPCEDLQKRKDVRAQQCKCEIPIYLMSCNSKTDIHSWENPTINSALIQSQTPLSPT